MTPENQAPHTPRIWVDTNTLQSLVLAEPDDDGSITIEHAWIEELLTLAGFEPTTRVLPPSLRSVAHDTQPCTATYNVDDQTIHCDATCHPWEHSGRHAGDRYSWPQ